MRGFCLKALFSTLQSPCVVVTATAAEYCKKLPFLFHNNAINLSPEALTPKQVTLQLQLCLCQLPVVKQLTAGFVYKLGYGT